MKRTLGVFIVLGIVTGLGYYVLLTPTTYTVQNPSLATSTSAVSDVPTPSELMEQATQKLIAEAISASSTEIEAAKEEAAKSIEKELRLKIERQVRLELNDGNDGALKKIEEELSF